MLWLALLVRVGVAVVLRTWEYPNRWAYAFEMGWIGGAVSEGMGFSWPGDPVQPTSWMAPAYPYLIAGVFELFGLFSRTSAAVLQALQTAASLATCVALYALGRRLFGRPAGLAAAALFAVYPPAIHFSVQKIWDASLFTLLVVGLTLLFLDLRDRPTVRRASGLGVLLGATALLEPTVLVLLPAGFLWLALRRGAAPRAARLAGAASLLALLAIAPWLVRNAVVFDRFVFVKSNFGHELLIGNLPIVRRGAHVEDVRVKGVPDEHLTAAEVALVERMSEAGRTRYYLDKATTHIRAHPMDFLRRSALRFLHFWTLLRGRGPGAVAVAFAYFALLLLALASLGLPEARGPDARLLWLFVVLLPVGNYLTVATHWRYRFPAEALLAVFAGLTLAEGWRRLRRRSSRPG